MDIEEHSKKYKEIIEKYNLSDERKAEEIAVFLTTHSKGKISSEEFAKLFAMKEEEAMIFLSFIQKGLRFKKENIDRR